MAIIIDEKDILNANTYIGLMQKDVLCRNIAELCVEPVEVKVNGEAGPNRYRENRRFRQQFLYGVLAKFYLKKDFNEQEIEYTDSNGKRTVTTVNYLMDTDDCNEWAASHVFNQIERFKRGYSKEVSNAAYDLLYDFKSFEMMLLGAIRDELEKENDLLGRVADYIFAQFSPENVQSALNEIESLQKQIEEVKNGAERE